MFKNRPLKKLFFDTDEFKKKYHYDGELGAFVKDGCATFKIWAPTASNVVLNLYGSGSEGKPYKNIDMRFCDNGIWSHTEEGAAGKYYTYTVTTHLGTQITADPYAKGAGLNGERSMAIDLSLTNPEGWEEDKAFRTGIKSYSEAIIGEVHVRDFSNKIANSEYKGKYLAFTENGLTNKSGIPVGIDYLKKLGITHVHLLPVYDYATVNEAEPDSQFNWGYDPKNYNVPEGSYSTDPYHGEVRVKEFKKMVLALHNAGIGVIMDVVYNHTYETNSSFNKTVPDYYYRHNADGSLSNASYCGNDTASERYMYGKFMTDSVLYWANEYHIDGFRFDLMGLHDLATMQKIEKALHSVKPDALIYGEGWVMGDTIDGSPQANQLNISKIVPTGEAVGGIAVFNDVIRDGLKGSVFNKTEGGYINGAPSSNIEKIMFGMSGGSRGGQPWSAENNMVINYMSAHDNHTLWDKLAITNPESSDEERLKMNLLGASIVILSKGTPFMQAGEEMLRTKHGEDNSYKSGDEINNIDWDSLSPNSLAYRAMMYYKGLFAIRRAYNIFTAQNVEIGFTELAGGALAAEYCRDGITEATVILNPTKSVLNYTLKKPMRLLANGSKAGKRTLSTDEGEIKVPALTAYVYIS